MQNEFNIIGRFGNDAEISETSTGNAVAYLKIATSEHWTDENGEKQENTDWHSLTAYKANLVTLLKDWGTKGRLVQVRGRMKPYNKANEDGSYTNGVSLVVDSLQFLDTKPE